VSRGDSCRTAPAFGDGPDGEKEKGSEENNEENQLVEDRRG